MNPIEIPAHPPVTRRVRLKVVLPALLVLLLGGGSLWWLTAQGPALPELPAPTLAPEIITVGGLTEVTATISIPYPRVNPTTVELHRVLENGSTEFVARMHDDGRNGDERPGDRNFTAVAALDDLAPQALRFYVSAAFRGVVRRSLSPATTVTIYQVEPITAILGPSGGRVGDAIPPYAIIPPDAMEQDIAFTLTMLPTDSIDGIPSILPVVAAFTLHAERPQNKPTGPYLLEPFFPEVEVPLTYTFPPGTTLNVLVVGSSGTWISADTTAVVQPSGASARLLIDDTTDFAIYVPLQPQ